MTWNDSKSLGLNQLKLFKYPYYFFYMNRLFDIGYISSLSQMQF